MARSQQRLTGDAKALFQELTRNPTPEVVHRINARYWDFIPRYIGSLSLEQRERYGLSMNDRGRLVIAAAIESERAQAAERVPMTPVDIAKAISKARRAPAPTVVKDPPLYVIGYEKPVPAGSVAKAWAGATGGTDKVTVMRPTVSIRDAEVSSITHAGAYDQVRTGGDKSVIARHASKLLVALTLPAPHSDRISWATQDGDGGVQYALQRMPLDGETDESVPTLVRSQVLSHALETGAVFGDFTQSDKRYRSPGRTFRLLGETAFAIDPELAAELADGVDIPHDEPLVLGPDIASVAEDFLGTEDVAILAPAYTSYVMSQRLAA